MRWNYTKSMALTGVCFAATRVAVGYVTARYPGDYESAWVGGLMMLVLCPLLGVVMDACAGVRAKAREWRGRSARSLRPL